MSEKFKISEIGIHGEILIKRAVYNTYEEALDEIKTLPNGVYQVQKVFIIDTEK